MKTVVLIEDDTAKVIVPNCFSRDYKYLRHEMGDDSYILYLRKFNSNIETEIRLEKRSTELIIIKNKVSKL